jgi:hypothetical protein
MEVEEIGEGSYIFHREDTRFLVQDKGILAKIAEAAKEIRVISSSYTSSRSRL